MLDTTFSHSLVKAGQEICICTSYKTPGVSLTIHPFTQWRLNPHELISELSTPSMFSWWETLKLEEVLNHKWSRNCPEEVHHQPSASPFQMESLATLTEEGSVELTGHCSCLYSRNQRSFSYPHWGRNRSNGPVYEAGTLTPPWMWSTAPTGDKLPRIRPKVLGRPVGIQEEKWYWEHSNSFSFANFLKVFLNFTYKNKLTSELQKKLRCYSIQ